MRTLLTVLFIAFAFGAGYGQTVYKTPSGKKYHTSVCKTVKNVSESMSIGEAQRRGLTACKICNPGKTSANSYDSNSKLGIKSGEAKEKATQAVQCKAKTKKGTRCKRKTKNINGYCFQHER